MPCLPKTHKYIYLYLTLPDRRAQGRGMGSTTILSTKSDLNSCNKLMNGLSGPKCMAIMMVRLQHPSDRAWPKAKTLFLKSIGRVPSKCADFSPRPLGFLFCPPLSRHSKNAYATAARTLIRLSRVVYLPQVARWHTLVSSNMLLLIKTLILRSTTCRLLYRPAAYVRQPRPSGMHSYLPN